MRSSVADRDSVSLVFENMMYHEGKIWFTESESNGLFIYDILSKETTLFYWFNEEAENTRRLFGAMLIKDDFLYLAPFAASSMYKLNIFTKECFQIPIKEPTCGMRAGYIKTAKFLSIFNYENRIYMVGASYPGILEYNIDTNELFYHDEWIADLIKYMLVEDTAFFRKTQMINDKIYAPFCRGNAVLVYHVKSNTYQIYQIGSRKCNFSAVCFDGCNFWLAPRNEGPVVRWNEEKCEYVEYEQFPANSVRTQNSSNDIVFFNGNILLMPGSDALVIKIDILSGQMQELDKGMRGMQNIAQCFGDDCIYFFSQKNGLLVCYDGERYHYEMVYIPKGKLAQRELPTEVIENRIETVEQFVSCIKKESSFENRLSRVKSKEGIRIWKSIS